MTVLRSPISAHTTVVPVDAPLSSPSYPIFYDLDAETIKVTDGADTTEWQVERGVANTQQAKHAKSVRLVANASPYGGSGGGVNVAQATATGTSAVLAVQDDLGAVGFRTNAHSNGTTTTSIYARGLGQDGITMRADDESAILRVAPEGRLGFFGKAFDPALQPSAPTTLTHVIDALKALGLVAS